MGKFEKSYLVALSGLAASTTRTAASTTRATGHGAVTRDVSGLAALVASLVVLGRLWAVTACNRLDEELIFDTGQILGHSLIWPSPDERES